MVAHGRTGDLYDFFNFGAREQEHCCGHMYLVGFWELFSGHWPFKLEAIQKHPKSSNIMKNLSNRESHLNMLSKLSPNLSKSNIPKDPWVPITWNHRAIYRVAHAELYYRCLNDSEKHSTFASNWDSNIQWASLSLKGQFLSGHFGRIVLISSHDWSFICPIERRTKTRSVDWNIYISLLGISMEILLPNI